ncbi:MULTISPECIES: rod shape-determining protein MreD [Treponema]|uniref:Rod shape-determining protein MreD n=1 Tax=Treponema succinifaciens (strain ATCC 33096 / DSM 2489 / 6091) TaxID=869209 RepID=F2NRS0_TRES6|nr:MULTISPECIES: rod shape-determining protein MreD [Treponema]AEB14156.1 rod shape-determining protein MreD [Treponema succinifaciens DSM 2489]
MLRAFFSSSAILLFVSVFEAAVLSNIVFLPALPDLSLICVLFFSINNGKIIGETTGFVSGLFLDFLSACPIGLNCLLRSVLGYLGGIFNRSLNTEGFFVPLFLGICATILKVLFIYLISMFFPLIVASYKIFSFSFLFEILMNGFLSPFVFKFLRLFRNSVILKPENIFQ